MDLSDGDDDGEGSENEANEKIVQASQPIETDINSDNASLSPHVPSHVMTANIVYNNQPQMYQSYYQNYNQQMLHQQGKIFAKNLARFTDGVIFLKYVSLALSKCLKALKCLVFLFYFARIIHGLQRRRS